MKLLRAWFDAAPSLALQVGNLQHNVLASIPDSAAGNSAFGRETEG
jgi:hypothetical protein